MDTLTLNEDSGPTQPKFDMGFNSFQNNKNGDVKEVSSKGSSPYLNEQSVDDKLKQFQGAKAISSDSFKNNNRYNFFFLLEED